MKQSEFSVFKNKIITKGINSTAWMGFIWINLTEKQAITVCQLAELQGLKPNENGYYQLENGLQFKKL